LRRAEVSALDVADVDLCDLTAFVKHGKGDKQRMVVFADDCACALREWLVARVAPNEAALFTSPTGKRLTPAGIYKIVRRIGKLAQVEVSTHRLRHTHATLYLESDGAIQDLSEQLGHSSLSTTMVYVHVTTERRRKKHRAASPLGRVLD
jgi:site-specific recombinase XerD